MKSFVAFLKENEVIKKRVKISDLSQAEGGVSNAQSSFYWGQPKISKKPIAVTVLPNGKHYVLDGYHRLEDARRKGKTHITAQYHPMNDVYLERAKHDKMLDGDK